MIPAPPSVEFVEDEDTIMERIRQDFIEELYSRNFLSEKE